MDSKYINQRRFKKSSSLNKNKRRKESISRKLLNKTQEPKQKPQSKEVKKPKKKKKLKMELPITVIFILIICILLIVSIVLRFVLKSPDEGFFDIFKIDIPTMIKSNIEIAVISDKIDDTNIVISELNSYVGELLLKINSDYSIEYNVVTNVTKNSNKEYLIYLKEEYKASDVIVYIKSLNNTIYEQNVSNIEKIEEENSSCIKVILKEDDPFFIYNLQIPIGNNGNYNKTNTSYSIKNQTDKYVNNVNVNSMTIEESVNRFNNDTLDLIITGNLSLSENLGKLSYDISSYKTGEMLVLLGNPENNIFSRKEVRQAIAYSINRQEILKDIYFNMGEIVDLPFVYGDSKYKYDIYDATNILLTNGYTLSNQIFGKYENDGYTKLSFELLVNESDDEKVSVAQKIKAQLADVGIEVNLQKLSSDSISNRVKAGKYELVLASIHVNENPSLDYIKEQIQVSSLVSAKLEEIFNLTDLSMISKEVRDLIDIMSKEISCIVIHADSAYVFSKKNIDGLSNIQYLNLFTNLLKR